VKTPQSERNWLTPEEAGRRLGYSLNQVYVLLHRGHLRGAQVQPKANWRVSRQHVEELDASINFNERNGDGP
jgi:excisionase family DNA binding protein